MYYKNFKTKSMFLQNNPRSSGEEIMLPEFPMQPHLGIAVNHSTASHYRVFLDGAIEESIKYRDLIQCLIEASEQDVVELVVSTDGGHLSTTVDIINAIRSSEAFTRAVITSDAHSAGSMIALACEEAVALPHACMLVHQPRGGSIGRYSEMVQDGEFNKNWTKTFYYDIYEDFFSAAEIDSVLNGKDVWLNSDEINQRLENRQELREKKQKKLVADFKKAQKNQQKVLDNLEKSDTISEEIKQEAGKSIRKKLKVNEEIT